MTLQEQIKARAVPVYLHARTRLIECTGYIHPRMQVSVLAYVVNGRLNLSKQWSCSRGLSYFFLEIWIKLILS